MHGYGRLAYRQCKEQHTCCCHACHASSQPCAFILCSALLAVKVLTSPSPSAALFPLPCSTPAEMLFFPLMLHLSRHIQVMSAALNALPLFQADERLLHMHCHDMRCCGLHLLPRSQPVPSSQPQGVMSRLLPAMPMHTARHAAWPHGHTLTFHCCCLPPSTCTRVLTLLPRRLPVCFCCLPPFSLSHELLACFSHAMQCAMPLSCLYKHMPCLCCHTHTDQRDEVMFEEEMRTCLPLPPAAMPCQMPFSFSLDGGGREMFESLLMLLFFQLW